MTWQQNVTLYQLRAFQAVMHHRNYTRAAVQLSLSQPSVSAHVHELERILGLPLFEQVGKRLIPTHAACVFEKHVEVVLADLELAAREIKALQSIECGCLELISSHTIANYLLPKMLGVYHARYPEVRISLAIKNSEAVCENVRRGLYELGTMESIYDNSDVELNCVPFYKDELVLIVSPWHPWARQEKLPLAALEKVPLLWREPGSGTRYITEKVLKQANIEPRVMIELGSNEALKQAVAANIGSAIISLAAVSTDVTAGLLAVVRFTDAPIERDFYVVYRRQGKLSPVTKTFLELLTHQDKSA